jgi:glyoxylase-like metal-dependent hydrolase (beta-lactamase superfamily II)
MDTVPVTPNLTMLRVNGWQLYVCHDGDSVTLIDTGAPGSGAEILAAAPGDRSASARRRRRRGRDPRGRGIATAGVRGLGSAHPSTGFGRLPDTAPSVPVDRVLSDGDVLDFGGGAQVLGIPGHTKGSIAIHLPSHRMLFTGDTIANVGTVMLGTFNQDRAQTVASFQRLAALDVETACFGHGDPIAAGAGDRIRQVAATLMP